MVRVKMMSWNRNKKLIAEGFRDLRYLPRRRCGWDSTLTSLAYGMRMAIDRRPPDLNAWASRHGLPAGARYEELGADALVLWHGTSGERAERILEHGLFHKRGLWTTTDPLVAHNYCRWRSDRFATEGAVVCIVLGSSEVVEGRDYVVEGKANVFRFHHGLGPKAVEYVLVHEQIRFTGVKRAHHPTPWPRAKFKKRQGAWVPMQKAPVRYSDSVGYGSAEEFARICIQRLLEELNDVTALEVFSCLYALVEPWEALEHEAILEVIEETCIPYRRRGKWETFRARECSPILNTAGKQEH